MRHAALATAWIAWTALLAWFVEGVAQATDGVAAGFTLGSLAALGFTALAALALSVLVSALLQLAGEGAAQAWWRFWVGSGAPPERAATLLGRMLLLPALALPAYLLSHRVIETLARSHFEAMGVVLVHAALALVAPWLAGACSRVARGLVAAPGLGHALGSPWRVAALAGGLGVALLAALGMGRPEVVRALPLEALARLLLCAVVAALLCRRLPAPRLRTLLAVELACAVVGLSAAGFVQPTDFAARALFEQQLWPSRVAARSLLDLSDPDGDGHSAYFGGGDCAPDDAAIFPGAVELPDNGIDEDCDGADLDSAALLQTRGQHDHPVPAAVPRRPHVLLITLDALNPNHLGAFDYPGKLTPRLDALAAEGVLFERCFAQGPSTRLSFPSLFTSRYDSEIRRSKARSHPYPIASSNRLLAQSMARAGYRTAAVLPAPYFSRSHWRGMTRGFSLVDETPVTRSAQKLGRGKEPPFNADDVSDAAIALLAREGAERPLFLWTHYYDTHAPHRAPPGSKPRGSSRLARYDAELAFMDGHVGRLVDAAREALGEQLLIVVAGDHGYGFGGRYKRSGYGYDLHTITLHVPLIFVAPFLEPRRVRSLCGLLDVVPTLANLLRLPSEGHDYRGSSLVPELLGQPSARAQLLFHQFFLYENNYRGKDTLKYVGVRTPRYNYLLDREGSRAQLFRWEEDFDEKVDRIASREPRDVEARKRLQQLASAFVYAVHGKAKRPPLPARPRKRGATAGPR